MAETCIMKIHNSRVREVTQKDHNLSNLLGSVSTNCQPLAPLTLTDKWEGRYYSQSTILQGLHFNRFDKISSTQQWKEHFEQPYLNHFLSNFAHSKTKITTSESESCEEQEEIEHCLMLSNHDQTVTAPLSPYPPPAARMPCCPDPQALPSSHLAGNGKGKDNLVTSPTSTPGAS